MVATVRWRLPSKQFLTFCAFGVANTLLHAGTVVLLVELSGANQVPANAMAFFVANVFSYAVNARFTFHRPLSVTGYVKFLGTSLATLLMTLLISSAGEVLGLHYMVTTATLIVLTPLITFTILKKFAFKT
ncbi:Putative flippase GtrA (transmembrane translocase of bactoprenol-linked glucose) [Devosia crocina]|uniref:Putative flippase GtrA (Transmembrane translocase of bactoprenol-linked glucose) n=1 Tax=Devosia crocina TaxID=429728 RepID=A0A1I7MWE5_9HYPH|nr:GtrA family protein [Devosia crocina]SFV26742.1 Putative flippase GtrA (transmembrane translocase of bactoprenol-linked glucose) [Devosia crocina]